MSPAPVIPIVDISAWGSGAAARAAIAAEVDAGCSEVGFLQVTGHGVPADVIADMLAAVDELFALPYETKLRSSPPSLEVNRGYAPMGAESLAYSLGVDAPPDLFEAFNLGPDDADPTLPAVAAEAGRLFAPNLWPDELTGFRSAATRYFAEVRALAHRLTSIFAVALGLDEGYFEPFTDHSTDTLRIVHYNYPPDLTELAPGQVRMGAHTDYGILTVLYADQVPGLELVGPDGAWHGVVPADGAYLVNLGDLLAQWSNDRWRSTVHRVAPPPVDGQPHRRRSLAFFHDGNWDATIDCLPTCCSADNPARYAPVRALDHLMNKLMGPRTGQAAEATGHIGDRIDAVRG